MPVDYATSLLEQITELLSNSEANYSLIVV
jgi:hypothetical protein